MATAFAQGGAGGALSSSGTAAGSFRAASPVSCWALARPSNDGTVLRQAQSHYPPRAVPVVRRRHGPRMHRCSALQLNPHAVQPAPRVAAPLQPQIGAQKGAAPALAPLPLPPSPALLTGRKTEKVTGTVSPAGRATPLPLLLVVVAAPSSVAATHTTLAAGERAATLLRRGRGRPVRHRAQAAGAPRLRLLSKVFMLTGSALQEQRRRSGASLTRMRDRRACPGPYLNGRQCTRQSCRPLRPLITPRAFRIVPSTAAKCHPPLGGRALGSGRWPR